MLEAGNKTFILLLISILFNLTSCGQTKIPPDFIETTPPELSSKEWYSLNNSQNEFSVSIIKGQLEVKKVKETYKSEIKIAGGTLSGVDRGEWGGKLTFIPSLSTQKAKEIKSGNIKFIFTFNNKIYFIEGIAHMSINEGALYELNRMGDDFTYKKIIDFDDAPEAFAIFQNKLLIATYQNFYVVENFEKKMIFNNTFWKGLYPNSIAVIDNENIFLGIRSGIAKLNLTNKSLKFYKFQ